MSPVARPFASSGVVREAGRGRGFDGITAPNDSPTPRHRVSADRLDRISRELTERDRETLLLVQSLRIATGGQLRRCFWPGAPNNGGGRAARRALSRLTDWRVLDRLPRVIGGVRAGSEGFCYQVGPIGWRLLASMGFESKRFGAPGDRYVAHTLDIAEAVVELREASNVGDLDVIEMQTEPACWRPFVGAAGARVVCKPDLFVRIGVGALEDRWLIEIDRATESQATIARKCRRYVEHYRSATEQRTYGVYPRVLWAVPHARRADQLDRAIHSLPHEAHPLFAVCLRSELISRLTTEAHS